MSRLFVRRLEQEDLPHRVAWFNNPVVYTQMVIDVPLSLAGTHHWFSATTLNPKRKDFIFEMRNENTLSPAAMGGLVDIDTNHKRAELYIVVNPDLIGQGIGSRAIRWLCNYGFLHLELNKICLFTLAKNPNARRLYERLGFVSEGLLRQHTWHMGTFNDRHTMSLLRVEWEASSWKSGFSLSEAGA